jgi:sugar O-acyltransferase (sialic acid O-acetyltransferase NeuD family)
MEKIAIYGAGGFGKDVLFLLETINKVDPKFDFVGFFDDEVDKDTIVCEYPVLGNTKELNQYTEPLQIIFAINEMGKVQKLVSSISNPNITFPNIAHPNSYVDFSTLALGMGNVFNINVIVSKDVQIGSFNSFNTRVALGHNVIVGDFNHFSPNAQISGGVEIGSNNTFGLNSSIIQNKKVGNNNKVGACSLIIRNVTDDNSVFGIPAIISKF